MKIQVTAEDISKGVRNLCNRCPTAKAILRATGMEYVSVRHFSICVGEKVYKTPVKVKQFIDKFDELGVGEPFEFELNMGDCDETLIQRSFIAA